MRIAILATHPIQYNAPLFRELASRQGIDLRVFYSWQGTKNSHDPEFGRFIDWDIPLLDGYSWEIVPNFSRDEGTHHFRGLDNPDMNRRVSQWRPDALLIYGWAWRTHLKAMRYFKGKIPVLLRGDSTLLTGSSARWKQLLRRPALQWVYRHVDIALSPGERNRAYLREMGVPQQNIKDMPHAIDTERFSPDRKEHRAGAERLRSEIGIHPGETTFVFAGKLVPHKEVDTLLTAYRLIADKHVSARLLIAGDGPERQRLEARSADLPGVSFIGFRNQSEMPSVYMAGDVFVLPSRLETWGLAVNEALSLGRPVVSSDRVGSAPELLVGKPYGWVYRCGDATALAEALDSVLMREDLATLGLMARHDREAWSIPTAVDALVAALTESINGNSAKERRLS